MWNFIFNAIIWVLALYGLIEIQGGKVAFTDFGNNLVNQFVDFNN